MGYLQDKHGVTLLGKTPEGTCPICAVAHDKDMPHNRDSLAYQYKFYDENGRWPTWRDAMAHCPDDVKAYWTQDLEARGINIDGGGENA